MTEILLTNLNTLCCLTIFGIFVCLNKSYRNYLLAKAKQFQCTRTVGICGGYCGLMFDCSSLDLSEWTKTDSVSELVKMPLHCDMSENWILGIFWEGECQILLCYRNLLGVRLILETCNSKTLIMWVVVVSEQLISGYWFMTLLLGCC